MRDEEWSYFCNFDTHIEYLKIKLNIIFQI